MRQRAAPGGGLLHETLLDFHATPGKYHVGRKQPALLFAAAEEVLRIAIGRDADPAYGPEHQRALQQAARFFTRTALLHPGADHYTLLGLNQSAEAQVIKDRYRLMMRLLHPDFSSAEPGLWPPGAPARVNLAYQLLSSPVARRAYDSSLRSAANPEPRGEPGRNAAGRGERFPHARDTRSRERLGGLTLAWGAGTAAVLGGALLLGGTREVTQLVQQTPPPSFPPASVQESVNRPTLEVAASQEAPTELAFSRPAALAGRRANTPTITGVLAASRVAPLQSLTAHETRAPAAATADQPLVPGRMTISGPVLVSAAALLLPAEPSSPAPSQQAAAPPLPPSPQPAVLAPPQLAVPGLTLAQTQPLLAALLQQLESGHGGRVINLLDPEFRRLPDAQALSRQVDAMLGARPQKLSHVEFRAEPADGRLFVVGRVQLQGADATGPDLTAKKLSLRIEFKSRGGNVVMTGLSGKGGD